MRVHLSLVGTLLVVGCSTLTLGQTTNPAPAATPAPLTVKRVEVYSTAHGWCGAPPSTTQTPSPMPTPPGEKPLAAPTPPCEAGVGDRLIVTVENLSHEVAGGRVNLQDLVVYINGRPLKGPNTRWWDTDQVVFDLKRTSDSTDEWSALLSKPGFKPFRLDAVSVGSIEKPYPAIDPHHPPTILLRLYHRYWAYFSLIALVLTLGVFLYLSRRTGIIRDPGPPRLQTTERPYSLARAQAAFWFFLVIGSFVFLYLVTGDYNTISDQALILMGIGTGTALGSAMIDASKRDSANDELSTLNPQKAQLSEELKQLAAQQTDLETKIAGAGANATAEDKQALGNLKVQTSQKQATLDDVQKKIDDASSGLSKPASEGFRKDLLTDADGINFHRFQMVVWTVVLGFLFLAGVYSSLAMPQFSGTLLALMGISSGTYLGFKIPEKQN